MRFFRYSLERLRHRCKNLWVTVSPYLRERRVYLRGARARRRLQSAAPFKVPAALSAFLTRFQEQKTTPAGGDAPAVMDADDLGLRLATLAVFGMERPPHPDGFPRL